MAKLNPFARSQMSFESPLNLIGCTYDGWKKSYTIEYRASRGAANIGLLSKQFAVGKPLVVEGKHVVVRSADMTLTNSTIDEVTIRVEAVDFADVLQAAQYGVASVTETKSKSEPDKVVSKVVKGNFGVPCRRKILS